MKVLNRLFQAIRYSKAIGCISDNSTVCDLGCGKDSLFLKKISGRIKKGYGLDTHYEGAYSNMSILKHNLEDKMPFDDGVFDHVTIIAVIEHLSHPEATVKDAYRILKKGGGVVITMPSPFADNILRILLRTPFFDDDEGASLHTSISVGDCCRILESAGFVDIRVEGFELGLNNLITAQKPPDRL